jgi:GNAT superfamily N-acetyltransferase
MSRYTIRRAVNTEAAIIATHRAAMFRDMGELPITQVPVMEAAMTPWFAERLTCGEYVGWFVEYEGEVVAGGGVLLRDLWAMPRSLVPGQSAHVGNVYTEPAHRRRGLARLIMETILDWCASNAIDLVTLSASPEGRPLYEQLGFTDDPRAMRFFSLSGTARNTPAYPRA